MKKIVIKMKSQPSDALYTDICEYLQNQIEEFYTPSKELFTIELQDYNECEILVCDDGKTTNRCEREAIADVGILMCKYHITNKGFKIRIVD